MEHSRFFWFDLMTSDVPAAKRFYAELTGWTTESFMDGAYEVLNAGAAGVGGLMSNAPRDNTQSASPVMWLGYVWVDDVDARTKRVAALGGKVHAPPQDIPGVGRFSVVADPQGATFALFKPTPPPGQTHDPAMSEAKGHIAWAELYTSDWEGAWRFYAELLGWNRTDTLDMGAMGKYALFGFGEGAQSSGGMMNVPGQPPTWLFYVAVSDTDQAAKQIMALGGTVQHGPMDVPGGGRVAQCIDPQGGRFGIFSRSS